MTPAAIAQRDLVAALGEEAWQGVLQEAEREQLVAPALWYRDQTG